MSMKLDVSKVLVTTVLVLATAGALGAQSPIPAPKVSTGNAKALHEVQDLLKAKKYSEVVTKANAILAGSSKTKDDTFVAYQFLLEAAKAQNDVPGMMKALEGEIDSGFLPTAGENLMCRTLQGLAYQQKDYKRAIDCGEKLIKEGRAEPDINQYVGQAYYQLKDYPATIHYIGDVIADKEKRGAKPERNDLILLQSAYDKAGNKDAAQAGLEKLVRYYPTSDTWLTLLYDLQRERLDPHQRLHLHRLMNATGNLKDARDYMAYTEASMALKLQAESQQALTSGLKANAFPAGSERDRAERYLKSASAAAATDKGKLAKMEADARAAPTGEPLFLLGAMDYSFGDYPKAIDALKAALAKGGLKNDAYVGMTLGEAQIKAGQKADAVKTFKSIKTDNDVTRRLVQLWILYAS
jgi:tetratricopeptide (TPR) repeat protein